ncbi:ras-related protein Rab-22A-like [Liolophura sinensis]|uniref:ras-related protein Rab-22A-like n=1 Tax=Liolophura sinensis TaxID=3198878 RepID=UPI0031586743
MSMRDVKVCLLGDSGVGKSSLVMRFVMDQFKPALESTIGASFMTKNLVHGDKTFKFQIWDTAGQEKYRALAPMYYRGAAAAIVVYDVTKESSFHTVKDWVKELHRHGPPRIVLAIAGNKCDLEDLREVSRKDAKDYAEEIGAVFTETSALTAANVPELFSQLATKLPSDVEPANQYRPRSTINIHQQSPERRRRGCCGGGGNSAANSTPESQAFR